MERRLKAMLGVRRPKEARGGRERRGVASIEGSMVPVISAKACVMEERVLRRVFFPNSVVLSHYREKEGGRIRV